MLKQMSLVLSTALCALAVGFPASAAHAAQPGVVAQAQADTDPGVLVWIDTDKGTGTYVPLDGRAGSTSIDGTIYLDEKDLSQGFGELFINQVASDGKSARNLRIAVNLSFGGGGGGGDNNDDDFGGF